MSSLVCSPFIDSLVRSCGQQAQLTSSQVTCNFCQEKNATMHCVECNESYCHVCSGGHQRAKISFSHEQIPLDDARVGNTIVKRIPRCQQHIGYEIDYYCNTCKEAICSRCTVEKHPKHDFCPLSQITDDRQDKIAGYTVFMTKKEEEAKKTVDTLDGAINKIEDHRSTAEKEIATLFASIYATVDARHTKILQQMQDKGNQLRKKAEEEKDRAESATLEFGGFCTATKGILAHGTPLEIVDTYKMVRA